MTIINKTYAACGMLKQISTEGCRYLPTAQLNLLLMTCDAVADECNNVLLAREAAKSADKQEPLVFPD